MPSGSFTLLSPILLCFQITPLCFRLRLYLTLALRWLRSALTTYLLRCCLRRNLAGCIRRHLCMLSRLTRRCLCSRVGRELCDVRLIDCGGWNDSREKPSVMGARTASRRIPLAARLVRPSPGFTQTLRCLPPSLGNAPRTYAMQR